MCGVSNDVIYNGDVIKPGIDVVGSQQARGIGAVKDD